MERTVALIACVIAFTGCTHQHLRVNTLSQVRTLPSLQQQQVLDNLAAFVVNPEALPFFSAPNGSTTQISDQFGNNNTFALSPIAFTTWSLVFSGQRQMNDNWTTTPLNDPDKLKRMRCAYQIAVGYENPECADCCELERKWQNNPPNFVCKDPCRTPSPGFFCVGRKRDVPRKACFVGRCGETYIWVPDHGIADLNNLTLTILDYATQKAPAPSPSPKQMVTRTWKAVYDPATNVLVRHELVNTQVSTEERIGRPPLVAGPLLTPPSVTDDIGADIKMQLRTTPNLSPEQRSKLEQELYRRQQDQFPAPLPEAVSPGLPERETFSDPLRGLINLPR